MPFNNLLEEWVILWILPIWYCSFVVTKPVSLRARISASMEVYDQADDLPRKLWLEVGKITIQRIMIAYIYIEKGGIPLSIYMYMQSLYYFSLKS